jgi:hypothetical protein
MQNQIIHGEERTMSVTTLKDWKDLKQALPTNSATQELSEAVQNLREVNTTIAEIEETLADLKLQQKHLSEDIIPPIMQGLGVKELKMSEGQKVSIKPFYAGKPIGSAGFNWLKENGFGDIVKAKLEIAYDFTAEPDVIANVRKIIADAGLMPVTATTVHHMTMGGFLREQDEKNVKLPEDLFQQYKVFRTTVK